MTASIDQYSSGLKSLIWRSRSTIILTATDCTLPAERFLRTFFHRNGESLYPTILSSILLACCAFTRSRSIFLGCATPFSMPVLVISLKVILSDASRGSPRSCARCHDIASPSRSGSVARYILSAFFASERRDFITSSLPFIS